MVFGRIAFLAASVIGAFIPCAAFGGTVTYVTDLTWRAFGLPGDAEGTPIDSVGVRWENDNLGWNTSFAYDDSSANGWHTPISRGVDSQFSYIWSEGAQFFGATPSYFRETFLVEGAPSSAFVDFSVDDDVQIWINGILAINDLNNTATNKFGIDVLPFIHQNENLIAIKAHDSFPFADFGENSEHLAVRLVIESNAVPEPSAALLFAGCCAALTLVNSFSRQRRNRCQVGMSPH
jgi:hypothetical protein